MNLNCVLHQPFSYSIKPFYHFEETKALFCAQNESELFKWHLRIICKQSLLLTQRKVEKHFENCAKQFFTCFHNFLLGMVSTSILLFLLADFIWSLYWQLPRLQGRQATGSLQNYAHSLHPWRGQKVVQGNFRLCTILFALCILAKASFEKSMVKLKFIKGSGHWWSLIYGQKCTSNS